jgi:hypothetical protein
MSDLLGSDIESDGESEEDDEEEEEEKDEVIVVKKTKLVKPVPPPVVVTNKAKNSVKSDHLKKVVKSSGVNPKAVVVKGPVEKADKKVKSAKGGDKKTLRN